MHVPINIPSLSISTKREVDINREVCANLTRPPICVTARCLVQLIAHGYSNVLSGLLGGLQNYLCYSNSLLYFKVGDLTPSHPHNLPYPTLIHPALQCGGGGPLSGYLLSLTTAVFMAIGPSVIFYMPRVMPGCLLMHIGVDLTIEGAAPSCSCSCS